MPTTVTYLFDPLCGWCYGATPSLDKLAAAPGLNLKLAPTGLFADEGARPMDAGFAAYAWSNDQRIAQLSGQAFSDAYRQNCLLTPGGMFDSGPATLALTAVALIAPDREWEMLKAIQKARYVEGEDVTQPTVLSRLMRGSGVSEAADRMVTRDETLLATNRARIVEAQAGMRRSGAGGVPALLVGDEPRRLIRANELFGNVEPLIAELTA